jgi:heme O synthase-like polyprenyltransferase
MMLPSASGKDSRNSAVHALIYTAFLLVVSLLPYTFGFVSMLGATVRGDNGRDLPYGQLPNFI